MSDYMSREAAFAVVEDEQKKLCPVGLWGRNFASDTDKYDAWQEILEELEVIPSADVEPVRQGRWEGYTHSRYCGIDEYGDPIYRDGTVYYCSNPKCRRKTVVKENFCPSCGAKMDLEG